MSANLGPIIKLIIGLFIFVGLPMLCWGVGDLGAFFHHPARLAYVIVVVVLQTFYITMIPGAGANRYGGDKLVKRQRVALALLQVVSLALVTLGPFSDRRDICVMGGGDLVRYIGLVAFAFGMMGMLWAEAALGRQFSVQVTIQEDHKLITSGPYRFIRHPRYIAIMIFSTGIALVFHSWLALVFAAAAVPVLLWRVADEETLMALEFGEEWQAYKKRSWKLVPWVY